MNLLEILFTITYSYLFTITYYLITFILLMRMRAKKIIFAFMATGSSLCAMSQEAADIAARLTGLPEYLSKAHFEVLLPQSTDPVEYDVMLQSHATPADTLSPCKYVITWSTLTAAKPTEGFSAYYDGNHYRYRNHRLQEYHAQASTDAFMPNGPEYRSKSGVQATAQFADLLPQFLGQRIQEMTQDPSYVFNVHPDTLISGVRRTAIDGTKRSNGYDVMRYIYVFDRDTFLPVKTEIENSPGSISEQIVTISYSFPDEDTRKMDITEEGLMDRWPEIFERYRENTFRSENLVNTMLPTFACQTLDGSNRYTHNVNEKFSSPVILVALDPNVATTQQTIAAVREAVDMVPMELQVLWAFGSNRAEDISELLGELRPGETALVSANSLLRNCGITLYPTIILADSSSKVTDVIPGFNKDTGMVVLQKTMLLK